MDGVTVAGLVDEEIIKAPGSINGEAVTLTALDNCKVFILDHSSDINVTNCKKCQIFIGPVDGLACFEGLNHCQIAVACNSFRAKACNSVDFEVLTASGPSIEESTDLRFCAWRATYPELQSQLDKIGLDVKKNAFDKVYDSSLGETPNFSLEEPLVHLEPPEIPRDSVPEEPTETHVPAPAPPAIFTQGSVDFLAGESPLSMAPAENGHASGSVFDAPLENTPLNLSQPPPLDELPTVIAAKEKLKERLAKQETAETKAREELLRNATAFIEDFYKVLYIFDQQELSAEADTVCGDARWGCPSSYKCLCLYNEFLNARFCTLNGEHVVSCSHVGVPLCGGSREASSSPH
eukprot:jgi/Botrbrau1/21434/Bobra.0216s0046.1